MEEDETPLVFDPEIMEILKATAPLVSKHWPNMEKIMIEEECNLFERILLKYLPRIAEFIDLEIYIEIDEHKEKGFAFLTYGNKVKTARRFEKQHLIPREEQDDFKAVYNKVED